MLPRRTGGASFHASAPRPEAGAGAENPNTPEKIVNPTSKLIAKGSIVSTSGPKLAIAAGLLLVLVATTNASTWTLDDAASPIVVSVNDATGRISVSVKSTGTVWGQGTAGGGSSWALNGTPSQPDTLNLSIPALLNTYPVTISYQLVPANGELKVTIGGSATQSIANGIVYPYPFFKTDGSGYAVLPFFGGFLVPTTDTAWAEPWTHSRLEWVGGTDSSKAEGWMAIADPADDMLLRKQTSTVSGSSRLGGAFQWKGSNANASLLSNRLSYDRTATFTFFTSGGYVAQAKKFREFAIAKGWHKSLIEKSATNAKVNDLLGVPLIYLWGDGRSQTMLDALSSAGIAKALILFSINHVDHNNAYPGSGWGAAVTAKGWVSGIYDIYSRYNASQNNPPLNGFYYLWPASANPNWLYITSAGTPSALDVAHSKSYSFARDTRIPAHIASFGLDGFFFDTTCALEPYEDYGTLYGYDHSASRAQDIGYRQALLAASSGTAPNNNKLTGTEMAKSWGIPFIHWAEGHFRNGKWGTPGQYGAWNNNAYPEVMVDVKDPGLTNEPNILSSGYQVPLFELIYHDTILNTQHWHTTHNKLLYVWDLSDRNALIRGQAPIFNLVYNGDIGTIGRVIGSATDALTGITWDMRWTNPNVQSRVMQTYNNVCTWHEIVGDLPMFDHKILTSDASNNYIVQNSEFSDDDGASGHGIVVNFGTYDGNHGMTNGSTWTGTIRGNNLSVPVGGFATYSWSSGDTTPPGPVTGLSATAGNTEVQLAWVNPGDADLAGIRVLRKTGSYPAGPTDGTIVLDDTTVPFATGVTDTGLANGTTYYYAVYAYDAVPNFSTPATANATPQPPSPVTLLDDGFETSFANWTDGGATDWDRTTAQKHSGSYSAHAGSADNDLTSDNLDTSGYSSITIEFWYRDDDIDDGDNIYLQLFNGSTYNNRFELGNTSPEDTWHYYSVTLNNSGGDAQYFRTNFRLKFEGTSIDSGENLWIDDVKVAGQ